MHPEDLDLLNAVHDVSLTPDGSTAVVSISHPDLRSDSYRGGLWAVSTSGPSSGLSSGLSSGSSSGSPSGRPARRLTNGEHDVAPAVSPDGLRVAFLRSGQDAVPQVHVTAIDGGEPLCLTDHVLGAGAPVWSPDGGHLAYSARVPEQGRYGTPDPEGEKAKPEAEPARLVTELAYRTDGLGHTRDRRQHLFVVEVPSSDVVAGADLPGLPLTPRQLTTGDRDDENPAWSPDGSLLAFLSASHDSRESDLRSAVHVVRADSSEPVESPAAVTGGDLTVGGAEWLPDGRLVLVATEVGAAGRDFVGLSGGLWVTREPADPGTALLELISFTSGDLEIDGGPRSLLVVADRVIVRDLHRGGVRLLSVDPDGSQVEEVLLGGHIVVGAQAASADGSVVVVVAGDQERAGDLGLVSGGEIHWLTDVSGPLRHEGGVRPRHELEATSKDGHPVHGWVVLPDPAAFGDGPHPVLLNIHGGPHSQYDWALFDEAQVYAGAGYAVLMCNPRGSAGYGRDHARAVRHAMGGVDAEDVIAFLDSALADSSLMLDAHRQGVLGGSYGGYLTALLTTRTDRFTAAVVERGYLDATSFVGSSDIGWFFPGEYHGTPKAMREQSPMTHVGDVTTPTLVIHSEADWRCPVEQGQRWFTALRMRGVPTELLLFPGEGHELSRSGRPRHRRQRFEHILRWWGEHLPVG